MTEVDWIEVGEEFRVAGFLAPKAEYFRNHFRSELGEWFAIAERLNALGQRMYVECSDLLPGRPVIDQTSIALQMMPRCLNSFQAAIILAERGMGVEAQILVRSLLETTFWMGYVGSDPSSAIPQLKRDTLVGEIGLFESALTYLEGVNPEKRNETQQQLAEMKHERDRLPKPPKIEKIAKLAGYGQSYFYYKDMSGSATHTSLKSIHGFLDHDPAGQVVGHQIGPDEDNVEKAVWFACKAMELAIDALSRAPGCSGFKDELEVLSKEIRQLELRFLAA